jgi:hypothetical protein
MRICLVVITVLLVGCGSRPVPDVSDPDPAAKVPGMHKAVREKSLANAGQLVGDLSSEDPAVRLYAINALQRLTGQTFGYVYYASQEQREPAVGQWKKWLAERPESRTK